MRVENGERRAVARNQPDSCAETRGKKGGHKKVSDYGVQLIEKQKVRFYYGVSERQFKNYVLESMDSSHPARTLFELLEYRLDSAVYRMGIALSRRATRQLVTHGHLTVNGRKVDIPSYRLSVNDKIAFREGSKTSRIYTDAVDRMKSAPNPAWMKCDSVTITGEITGVPVNPDPMLNFQSVIEFYSR